MNRVKNGWVNTQCPFCNDTSTHLGFNIDQDYAVCFRCGGHNLRMTLIKLLNIPANTLSQILEPFQAKNKILTKLNEKEKLNKDKIKLPDFPLSKAEKDYLYDRHFNPDFLERNFNIQGGGWVGDWKNRIIIPIFIGGKLVSWTGRTILKDKEPRYKNLENELSVIDPKKIFFNLDNCYEKTAALLEGPFDVLRFGDNGICGFGITLTKAQVFYLSERFKKIYILFDSEWQAQKKAREIGMTLQGQGLDVFICDVFGDFGCKDAGEMSPFKMKQLKKELSVYYKNEKGEVLFF
jgi:DNA primase